MFTIENSWMKSLCLCLLYSQYVKDNVGPLAREFVQNMCTCSQTYCSGHGRCMPR